MSDAGSEWVLLSDRNDEERVAATFWDDGDIVLEQYGNEILLTPYEQTELYYELHRRRREAGLPT